MARSSSAIIRVQTVTNAKWLKLNENYADAQHYIGDLKERIAELEAELDRLRAERWEPVGDGVVCRDGDLDTVCGLDGWLLWIRQAGRWGTGTMSITYAVGDEMTLRAIGRDAGQTYYWPPTMGDTPPPDIGTGYYTPPPVAQGWQCPVCKTVYAPSVLKCECAKVAQWQSAVAKSGIATTPQTDKEAAE